MLYWSLLCSVLYTFDVRICLILVAARYWIGLYFWIQLPDGTLCVYYEFVNILLRWFSYGIVGSQC